MKNIKLFFLSILVVFMSASCDDALDINTDPLVATSADPNAVLPYVFVQYSNRHTTELGTRIMDVPQHFSACFNSPRNGSTSIFLTGNTWFMYYNQVLGNLQLVEQDATEAGPSSNNVNAIAKIWKAKAFFELASIWGDIPYTEALDGVSFPSPKFDSQESVFRGVLQTLDEAIALIDAIPAEGVKDVSTGDLIYNGNMENWRRWANSLKLRILMMIRNVDSSVDSEITKVLGEPLIETNSQAAMLRYADQPGQSNAFNQIIEAFFGISNEVQEIHAPGIPLFSLLENDPRKDLFIFDPDMGGAPEVNGTFPDSDDAVIADNVIRDDLPHIMFLPSEINFYRAELALSGVTSDDAQTQFDEGLRNIMNFWGNDIPGVQKRLDAAAIDAHIASLPPVDLQSVQEQLYLESFMRPVIAWNTVRRTGVPALDPPPSSSISTILKRFNYPPDEVSSNLNTPANLPTDTPMWFEK